MGRNDRTRIPRAASRGLLFPVVLAAVKLLSFNSVAPAQTPLYTVTDLCTLGGPVSGATAINNKGQIVGSSNTGQIVGGQVQSHAFLYQNGVMSDLGALPTGHSSKAMGINESGQIVGESYTNGYGPQHAFLYENGTMTDLGTLAGESSSISIAYSINANGQAVGFSSGPGGSARGFIYQSGGMTDLGTLGGTDSNAFAINGAGQIVGNADSATIGPRAFLYQKRTNGRSRYAWWTLEFGAGD
jgi:probable HAF family extracellular repeat protein